MIVEEFEIRYESAAAEASARRLQQVHDQAMENMVVSGERATQSLRRFGDAQEKSTNRVHQLRMGMFQLGSAMAVTGGRTGILINAFAEMGAMMLSGGVLGLGIGAITAAFTTWNLIMGETEQKTKAATDALREQLSEIRRYREATDEMVAGLRKEGLTSQYGAAGGRARFAADELQRMRDLDEAMRAERAPLWLKSQGGGTLTDAEAERLRVLNESIRALNERQRVMREELDVARQLVREEQRRIRKPGPAPTTFSTEDIEYMNEQFAYGAAAERARDPVFETWDVEGQKRAEYYQQRIEDPLNEIAEANAIRRAEIEGKNLEESGERWNRWGDIASDAFGTVTDASLQALEAMVAGEEFAAEKMATSVLKGLGRQLVGMGIADVSKGISRALGSYGLDATAEGLITHGAAEIAIGTAMAATGAVVAGNMSRGSGGGGRGGGYEAGDFGAGGYTPTREVKAEKEERPITIIVQGPFTADETAAMIDRGIEEVHARGIR